MAKKKTAGPTITDLSIPPAANAAEVPSLYVNNVQLLSISTIDVRLAFNEISLEGTKGTTRRKANIVMSIPHFVAMVGMLSANVESLADVGQEQ